MNGDFDEILSSISRDILSIFHAWKKFSLEEIMRYFFKIIRVLFQIMYVIKAVICQDKITTKYIIENLSDNL